ncbi:hypothetical protein LXA43DRAFT_1158392 [Ganoderma leucocontextum]|nr:hypothetical protein LXA43DRAFT_1158392 [Ganoderma leucocontextum]
MLIPAGPFPVMWVAYCIIGFTLAVQTVQATGSMASLKKGSAAKMGFLHGTYGLGALASPLIAMHLYMINIAVPWIVFRGRRQKAVMDEEGETDNGADVARSDKFRSMMRLKEVHFLSFFALIYIGVEVTLGGWSVAYILKRRGGSCNSGYISSGFFGGIMLGRVLLLRLNKKLVERRTLFFYAMLSIGLEVTIWLIPSLIENAIAVAVVGLLLGLMFPILMNHSTIILPRWLMTGCAMYRWSESRPSYHS